jgi:L-lactate dehydrogenase complex protein LldF
MRHAVANAQDRIGINRQKMIDELENWPDWRSRAADIRAHVLENLDAYLYQLSEKVTANGGTVFLPTREKMPPATFCRLRSRNRLAKS